MGITFSDGQMVTAGKSILFKAKSVSSIVVIIGDANQLAKILKTSQEPNITATKNTINQTHLRKMNQG